MHTIKPLDVKAVEEACSSSKMIISVEEHNIIGGLGSAISEQKSKISNSPKLLTIGIEDQYSKGGSYKFLLEKHGLTSEKIASKILTSYNH